MKAILLAAIPLVLLIFVALLISGCEPTGQAQTQDGFAPGAFPPTISDMEYHSRSWTRADCLACHETGVKQAPLMVHASVPPLAQDSKCRTCHVFVPGSKPR